MPKELGAIQFGWATTGFICAHMQFNKFLIYLQDNKSNPEQTFLEANSVEIHRT